MRLKTLEMQGFKSFPEKTTINFENGVTIVVGPNGCGKSNISDAMKWVLGDISSKSMRGESMEDVIFAGSEKRSPMNFAQVTVTFDTSEEAGRLAGYEDYDEVSVTRKYLRAGESEYLINKKEMRRKDIISLFMNTGVGKNGYSIVGQGKISDIISTNSSDRRKVLEEAAGIAKFRSMKNETEKKLDQVVNNLAIAETTEFELESRLKPLEKDSEKAKKYIDIVTEKKQIDVSLSAYDIQMAKSEFDALETQLATDRQNYEYHQMTLTETQDKYERTFNSLQETKRFIEKDLEELNRISKNIAEIEKKTGNAENANIYLAKQRDLAKEKIAELQKTFALLSDGYKAKSDEYDISNAKLEKLRAECIEIKEKDDSLTDKRYDLGEEISKLEEQFESIRNFDVEAQIELSAKTTKNESSIEKAEGLNDQRESIQSDIDLLSQRIKTCDSRIETYTKKQNEIQTNLDTLKNFETELVNLKNSKLEEKNEYFLDVSSRKNQIYNLERMDELFEGYSRAVKFIMSELKEGKMNAPDGSKPKIDGPVSSVVTVDEKYALALETAFGAQLQNIIVDDEDTAKFAISYLKKNNAGRATFYPADTMIGNPLIYSQANPRGLPGYVAIASTLVKCDTKYRGIIDYLLGRTIVAENLDKATDIAKSAGYKYKIVTLDGQVINAGGSYTGGSNTNDSGILSRKATCDKLKLEIEELNVKVKKLEEEIADNEKQLADVISKQNRENANLDMAKNLLMAEKSNRASLETAIEKDRESLKETETQLEALGLLMTEEQDSKDKLIEKRKQYENLIKQIEEDIETKKVQIEEIDKELDIIRDKYADVQKELSSEEKQNALISQYLEVQNEKLDETKAEIEEAENLYETSVNQIETNISSNEQYVQDIENLKNTEKELTEEKERLSGESIELETKVNSLMAKQKELQTIVENEFRNVSILENKQANAKEKYSKLIDFLWEEYEITLTEISELKDNPITKENRHEYVQNQTRLKNQLRALGSVNVNAIEEYRDVKSRYEELNAQTSDLRKSKEDMTLTIKRLEKEMQESFTEMITKINENFNTVVSELFRGGSAKIAIEDPNDILNCDIDIQAVLPGKKIKSISLLSGGEKTLVAIGLYFAMLRVNPSPFCILDEIDAALDDANVDIFANYLRHYTDRTQFIIITHKRGTMHAADMIYGVTMHEKGKTDVIPVEISEIEKKIGVELT